jgi:zinc transporter 1/2/3
VVPRGGHTAPLSDSSAAASSISVSTATPYGIPLHLWKVIFQALLTAINVACWLIPLKSKKISDNKLGLSLANAFSGGVFLSLAFGHLIPECVGGFAETAGGSASLSRLPAETPYLLVLGGYLLIFFVEKVAFDAHEILHEMEEGGGGGATAAGHGHQHPPSPRMANGGAVAAKRGIVSHVDSPARSVSSSGDTAAQSSGRSAVILLGALAVHSVLEMTALGLSNSFGDCALLTLSIALHQPAESIALLVAFLKSGMPRSQIVQYLSIFSCMGPIGVGLGMAVNEYASPVVDSVMLAVVAGTFVYVGATEVIPEEWEDSAHKWPKFVALMSGIACIVTITQYTMSLH